MFMFKYYCMNFMIVIFVLYFQVSVISNILIGLRRMFCRLRMVIIVYNVFVVFEINCYLFLILYFCLYVYV